uniref:Protein kinase domain-containing protein n=1 Tax=Syphacia muris TaxID=451379 RepID=A0A0N5AEP7_9BILA
MKYPKNSEKMLRKLSWKLIRSVSATVTILVSGSSLYFLHQNDYDLSSIGLVRFARAGVAVSHIIVDYKWTMWKYRDDVNNYQKGMKAAHRRSALRLLELAKANGGVFIKVGQHLAASEYLLPQEYTEVLSVLHSRAPESNLKELYKVFEEDMHKKACIEDVFSEFDPRPLGAASLAQVHKAKLKGTNEVVAVKIQHPRVKPHSLVDIASMEVLARIAAKVFPDFYLSWLVDEVKRNLPIELDFLNEATNADRIRGLYSHLHFLKVPIIYYQYSSSRVLTMEFCEGAQINDLDYLVAKNIDRYDICRKLGILYSEMIFVKGIVHCDPHPGNVLVHKSPDGDVKIVLLDHGQYLNLPDDFRLKYSKLWLAILKPDQDEIKKYAAEMGVGELYGLFTCMITRRTWKAVVYGVNKTAFGENEKAEIKAYAASLITQITEVLQNMPRPLLLILKTNDLLKSIEYQLGTYNRADTFIEMSKCCTRSVYEAKMRGKSILSRIFLLFNMYTVMLKLILYEKYQFFINRHYAQSLVL